MEERDAVCSYAAAPVGFWGSRGALPGVPECPAPTKRGSHASATVWHC